MRLLLLTTLLCGFTGCTNTAPVPEIRQFGAAFAAVDTVSQTLLDDLAIAERQRGRQIAVRRAKGESNDGTEACPRATIPWQAAPGERGYIRGFCLPDAGYFAEIGDPPSTARLRRGLAVIGRYAELLAILAEGRNIDAALGEVDALGAEVSGLLALGGVPGEPLGAALVALRPVLDAAARQSNAAEAKRLILEGAPKVTDLIEALRTAAAPMFDALVEPGGQRLLPLEEGDAIDGELARIEAYRIAVANYVALLDRLRDAWAATVIAAQATPGRANVALLVERVARLRSDAEVARRVFAILRAGGTPNAAPTP